MIEMQWHYILFRHVYHRRIWVGKRIASGCRKKIANDKALNVFIDQKSSHRIEYACMNWVNQIHRLHNFPLSCSLQPRLYWVAREFAHLTFALTEKLTKKKCVGMHKNWSGKLKVNIFAGKFSFLFLNFILFAYYFGMRLFENFLLD